MEGIATTMTALAAQYGTVSDIEVLWTLIAVAGLAFSIYNVRDAIKDHNVLGTITNGRRAIANLAIRMEATRIIIQGIFVAIGLMALFVPEINNQLDLPTQYLILNTLVRWGFIVTAVLILYQSYANYTLRRYILANVRADLRVAAAHRAGVMEPQPDEAKGPDDPQEVVLVEVVNPDPVPVRIEESHNKEEQ